MELDDLARIAQLIAACTTIARNLTAAARNAATRQPRER